MQTAPLSKIPTSSTLQAAVMKHFRVESETQGGQPQPGPGGVCGVVLSLHPKISSLLWLSQAFWGCSGTEGSL